MSKRNLPKTFVVRPCGVAGLQISLPIEWIDAEGVEDRDRVEMRRDGARLVLEHVKRQRITPSIEDVKRELAKAKGRQG